MEGEKIVTTYCSAANVASFMQVPTFDGSTSPTQTEVEDWINEAEDQIDEHTMHAWREVTITEEVHDLNQSSYGYYHGTDIHLEHRNIKDLSSGSGDKLEVWNGSEYEDYLVTRTEGRNNDYWFDKTLGIIFIKTYPRQFYAQRKFNVRVTYRFGDAVVVKDIKKACVRLAAIEALQGDDKSVLLPEGSNNISLSNKTDKWEEQADKLMNKHRELQLAVI